VELRNGYSNPDNALWGTIVAVECQESIDRFFDRVPFQDVIPTASDRAEAIAVAESILNIDSEDPRPVLGFQVVLEK